MFSLLDHRFLCCFVCKVGLTKSGQSTLIGLQFNVGIKRVINVKGNLSQCNKCADLIEKMWVNLSSVAHHLDSCEALRVAANSQQMAAESQRKACQSTAVYLAKQRWVIKTQTCLMHDAYFAFICFFIQLQRELLDEEMQDQGCPNLELNRTELCSLLLNISYIVAFNRYYPKQMLRCRDFLDRCYILPH